MKNSRSWRFAVVDKISSTHKNLSIYWVRFSISRIKHGRIGEPREQRRPVDSWVVRPVGKFNEVCNTLLCFEMVHYTRTLAVSVV